MGEVCGPDWPCNPDPVHKGWSGVGATSALCQPCVLHAAKHILNLLACSAQGRSDCGSNLRPMGGSSRPGDGALSGLDSASGLYL